MRKQTRQWTTKDGTKVRICDMTDSHLRNTIRMLVRNAMELRQHIPYPMFQGEMAQFYAERDYDMLWETPVEDLPPLFIDIDVLLWESLMLDAERRGLELGLDNLSTGP